MGGVSSIGSAGWWLCMAMMASVGYAGQLTVRLDLQCSEGASPICGGGAGGSFSHVGAANSLQPPSSVV